MRTRPAVPAALLFAVALAPASAEARPACLGRRATIVGTAGDDELRGTGGADVIHAGGGRDEVYAGGGNDVVCGGGNNDHLYGGRGADRMHGGSGYVDDWLFGGDGPDVLFPGCSHEEGDLLEGGEGADHLEGASCGYATMTPGPGDDFVDATRGVISFTTSERGVLVDLAKGTARGQGRDRIEIDREPRAPAHALPTIVGTPAADELLGGPYRDAFEGGYGDDVVRARGGDDVLIGSPGADALWGGKGDDTFYPYGENDGHGGHGADRVVCEPRFEQEDVTFDGGPGSDWELFVRSPGEASADLGAGTSSCSYTYDSIPPSTVTMDISLEDVENVEGDRAALTVTGSDGPNAIVGSREADRIDAGGGADRVVAGPGADELFGGGGDDTLDGEGGEDSANGGPGTDRCTAETQESCES